VVPSYEHINEIAGHVDGAKAEVTHNISRRRSW
jgi:hypothetical protein